MICLCKCQQWFITSVVIIMFMAEGPFLCHSQSSNAMTRGCSPSESCIKKCNHTFASADTFCDDPSTMVCLKFNTSCIHACDLSELTNCTNCSPDLPNNNCGTLCSRTCMDSPCNITSICNECLPGYYGEKCEKICSAECNSSCYIDSGYCKTCALGFYGRSCEKQCPKSCLHKNCSTKTGICFECKEGFWGHDCTRRCFPGFYGSRCLNRCPEHCAQSYCDYVDGSCRHGCKPGYYGPKCQRKCPPGTYGSSCLSHCSVTCVNSSQCHHVDGACLYGCATGFRGASCREVCPAGTYGENCNLNCSDNCLMELCNAFSGHCHGCIEGKDGPFCSEAIIVPPKARPYDEITTDQVILVFLALTTMGVTLWVVTGLSMYYRNLFAIKEIIAKGQKPPPEYKSPRYHGLHFAPLKATWKPLFEARKLSKLSRRRDKKQEVQAIRKVIDSAGEMSGDDISSIKDELLPRGKIPRDTEITTDQLKPRKLRKKGTKTHGRRPYRDMTKSSQTNITYSLTPREDMSTVSRSSIAFDLGSRGDMETEETRKTTKYSFRPRMDMIQKTISSTTEDLKSTEDMLNEIMTRTTYDSRARRTSSKETISSIASDTITRKDRGRYTISTTAYLTTLDELPRDAISTSTYYDSWSRSFDARDTESWKTYDLTSPKVIRGITEDGTFWKRRPRDTISNTTFVKAPRLRDRDSTGTVRFDVKSQKEIVSDVICSDRDERLFDRTSRGETSNIKKMREEGPSDASSREESQSSTGIRGESLISTTSMAKSSSEGSLSTATTKEESPGGPVRRGERKGVDGTRRQEDIMLEKERISTSDDLSLRSGKERYPINTETYVLSQTTDSKEDTIRRGMEDIRQKSSTPTESRKDDDVTRKDAKVREETLQQPGKADGGIYSRDKTSVGKELDTSLTDNVQQISRDALPESKTYQTSLSETTEDTTTTTDIDKRVPVSPQGEDAQKLDGAKHLDGVNHVDSLEEHPESIKEIKVPSYEGICTSQHDSDRENDKCICSLMALQGSYESPLTSQDIPVYYDMGMMRPMGPVSSIAVTNSMPILTTETSATTSESDTDTGTESSSAESSESTSESDSMTEGTTATATTTATTAETTTESTSEMEESDTDTTIVGTYATYTSETSPSDEESENSDEGMEEVFPKREQSSYLKMKASRLEPDDRVGETFSSSTQGSAKFAPDNVVPFDKSSLTATEQDIHVRSTESQTSTRGIDKTKPEKQGVLRRGYKIMTGFMNNLGKYVIRRPEKISDTVMATESDLGLLPPKRPEGFEFLLPRLERWRRSGAPPYDIRQGVLEIVDEKPNARSHVVKEKPSTSGYTCQSEPQANRSVLTIHRRQQPLTESSGRKSYTTSETKSQVTTSSTTTTREGTEELRSSDTSLTDRQTSSRQRSAITSSATARSTTTHNDEDLKSAFIMHKHGDGTDENSTTSPTRTQGHDKEEAHRIGDKEYKLTTVGAKGFANHPRSSAFGLAKMPHTISGAGQRRQRPSSKRRKTSRVADEMTSSRPTSLTSSYTNSRYRGSGDTKATSSASSATSTMEMSTSLQVSYPHWYEPKHKMSSSTNKSSE